MEVCWAFAVLAERWELRYVSIGYNSVVGFVALAALLAHSAEPALDAEDVVGRRSSVFNGFLQAEELVFLEVSEFVFEFLGEEAVLVKGAV